MSTLASVVEYDLIANRPAAGIPGRVFWASDTQVGYRDNGTTWDQITFSGGGGISTTTGAIASLPPAGNSGNLYLPNDSLYDVLRDNGSSWDYFYRGRKVTPPGTYTWTWTNQGSATVTQQTNGVRSYLQPSLGATNSLAIQTTPLSGSSWSHVVRFRTTVPNQQFNQGGAILRESATGKLISFTFAGAIATATDAGIQIGKLTNPTTFSAAYLSFDASVVQGDPFCFKMALAAGNITWSMSNDNGVTWIDLLTESQTDFFTTGPDQIGVYVNANNQAGSLPAQLTLIGLE